ncbi:hypothetical protein [Roseovarius salis]|uniref:hypothetical protein n=1 Tax=Roseovarius salis TaxID=3376063 RepID=UPI0037CC998A
MTKLICLFTRDASGAASVDWVTLTAAVVVLGVSSVSAAQMGVIDLGSRVMDGVTVHDSGAD